MSDVDPEKYGDEHAAYALKEAANAFEEAADAINDLHVEGFDGDDVSSLRSTQRTLRDWAGTFDKIRSESFGGVEE